MISTTIKRVHLEDKFLQQEEKGHFIERKPVNDYWRKRIEKHCNQEVLLKDGPITTLNLLCGRDSYKAVVLDIWIDETPKDLLPLLLVDICYNIKARFLSNVTDTVEETN